MLRRGCRIRTETSGNGVRAFGARRGYGSRSRLRAARPVASRRPRRSSAKASTTRRRQIDLACTDVVVAGTLQVYERRPRQRAPHHDPAGGTIDGGSGVIAARRQLEQQRRVHAGTRRSHSTTVRHHQRDDRRQHDVLQRELRLVDRQELRDSRSAPRRRSARARDRRATPNPIQFPQRTAGQVDQRQLARGGTQQIQHVGVTDVWATGQHLAPT
jgi:hypothetical protein